MTPPAPLRAWTIGHLAPDVQTALERLRHLEDVVHIAVMPDVHLAEAVCVGVALATEDLLYPAAIGGDVGCGVAALRFQGPAAPVAEDRVASRILALLGRLAPVHHFPTATLAVLSPTRLPDLDALPALSDSRLERLRAREGRLQLGTLGRGNHFLELQSDEAGDLWGMVHTGSRAMGPAIQAWHRAQATHHRGGLAAIAATSAAGARYLADLDWAQRYARLNRQHLLTAVAAVVEAVLGYAPDLDSRIDGDHNHVRAETHGGRRLWVHRKGALCAAEGLRAVIPGSMGTPSFRVEGRGCVEALGSSSHGAGRRLSRTAARSQIAPAQLLEQVGAVQMDRRWGRLQGLVEEAPGAYQDITAVMRAQGALTRVVGQHRPLLNHKGQ